MTRPPRGEARRELLLEATLRLAGRTGPEAITHRRVAAEAQLPLAATTYWFSSKEQLIGEAYALAAARDIDRVQRVTAELLVGPDRSPGALVAALAGLVAHELAGDRATVVASYALWLEAARRPELRETARGWTAAYVAAAARVLERAGSPDATTDARLVVAVLDDLLLEQLSADEPDFEQRVLRPALTRLLGALLAR